MFNLPNVGRHPLIFDFALESPVMDRVWKVFFGIFLDFFQFSFFPTFWAPLSWEIGRLGSNWPF